MLAADDIEHKAEHAMQELLRQGNAGPFFADRNGGLPFRNLVRDAVRSYKGTHSFIRSFQNPLNLDDPHGSVTYFIRAANILYWEAKNGDTELATDSRKPAAITQILDTGGTTPHDVTGTQGDDRAGPRRRGQINRRNNPKGRRIDERRNLDMGPTFRGIEKRPIS